MFGKRKNNEVCISLKEAIEINKKWRELKYNLELLKKENLKLKKENKTLKKELKSLEKDEPFFNVIDGLRKKIKILEEENSLLKRRNKFLLRINQFLFSLLFKLEEQNNKITKNFFLREKDYELENKRLLLEINSLKEEIEKYEKEELSNIVKIKNTTSNNKESNNTKEKTKHNIFTRFNIRV